MWPPSHWMLQTSTACRHLKTTEQHSEAQETLAQAATNNREKEKALRQKRKPVGACKSVQKAARAGEALGKRAGRGRGKKYTQKL